MYLHSSDDIGTFIWGKILLYIKVVCGIIALSVWKSIQYLYREMIQMWKNQYHPVSQLSQCIYLLLPFKLDVVELHTSLLPLNNKIFVSTKFLWWCKKFHWFRLLHIWFSQSGLLLLGKFPDTLIWNEKKAQV